MLPDDAREGSKRRRCGGNCLLTGEKRIAPGVTNSPLPLPGSAPVQTTMRHIHGDLKGQSLSYCTPSKRCQGLPKWAATGRGPSRPAHTSATPERLDHGSWVDVSTRRSEGRWRDAGQPFADIWSLKMGRNFYSGGLGKVLWRRVAVVATQPPQHPPATALIRAFLTLPPTIESHQNLGLRQGLWQDLRGHHQD